MGWGIYGSFPLTFGDTSDDAHEVEHKALLDALEPGFSPEEDTAHDIETYAHALAMAMIWDANERLANQAIPEKMIDALPIWEETLKLTPTIGQSDQSRRAAVAAKLRGLINNALPDIEAAAKKAAGTSFHSLVLADPSNTVSYWPGGIPGPPGYEWTSSRALIGIRLTKAGLSDAQFNAIRSAIVNALDAMIPAWMTFSIGTGSSFICAQGVVGETYL